MFLFFETSTGYALFEVELVKIREISEVWKYFQNYEDASSIVKLKAFKPFLSASEALVAATNLLENKLDPNLKNFLEKNMISSSDELAVSDPKFGELLKHEMHIECINNDLVVELFRGIRTHLDRLLTRADVEEVGGTSAPLSADQVDPIVIQTLGLLDDLDKEMDISILRIREFYGCHFPEMTMIITEPLCYARCILRMGMRNECKSHDFFDILGDSMIEEDLKKTAEISRGTEISQIDLQNIQLLCEQLISLSDHRIQLFDYLKNRMAIIAPNLTMKVGELEGARLIARAGSLLNLSKLPASTLQILGAEKALFRALKAKHTNPKYREIYDATLTNTAKHKGKISRVLAARTALAIRVDALGDTARSTFPIENRSQVEENFEQSEGSDMTPSRDLSLSSSSTTSSPLTTSAVIDQWNCFCLFAKEGYFLHNMREYDPKSESISFASLVKRPFQITNPREAHLEALVQLESSCWESHLQIDQQEILDRLKSSPQNIWIALMDDTVVGVIYTQRVASIDSFRNCFTFSNHRSFQSPKGSILQLITVAANKFVKDLQIGQHLRDFMLLQCQVDPNLIGVAAVTRCSSYQPNTLHSYPSYVSNIIDPTLRFHCSSGAEIIQIIKDYRPADTSNNGNGVLIYYSKESIKRGGGGGGGAQLVPQDQKRKLTLEELHKFVEHIVTKNIPFDNFVDRPFMTIGLDSLQMQELASQLKVYAQGKPISSTLLFDRPTPRDILKYFEVDKIPNFISNKTFESSSRVEHCEYAIVGMSCRLPGNGNSPESYYQMLNNGQCAIQPLPLESWGWKLDVDSASKVYSGGILDGSVAESFDESFFGINSAEVELMDPHHRILLEVCYEALDQAHLEISQRGCTGVYVGLCNTQWNSILMADQTQSQSADPLDPIGPYASMGGSSAAAANRISFHLNLTGPSMVIDTACSSSLVAIDQACGALERGDCDTAIVAAADLILCPYTIEVRVLYFQLTQSSLDPRSIENACSRRFMQSV
jgi:nucleolar protein 58